MSKAVVGPVLLIPVLLPLVNIALEIFTFPRMSNTLEGEDALMPILSPVTKKIFEILLSP